MKETGEITADVVETTTNTVDVRDYFMISKFQKKG